ncbi:MAG: hypothetical protein K1X64_22675, partial [Myxococcaceae bacterium]|nr:hypothetical protein [Myxococcaceae bacterium]
MISAVLTSVVLLAGPTGPAAEKAPNAAAWAKQVKCPEGTKPERERVRGDEPTMACVERGIGRQGPYWHASAKGLLIERGQYKNGDPAGVWTQWLETGSVAKQTTYADDGSVLHEVTFFENGNKDREATYAGRRRVNTKAEYERIPAGTTRQWFPDGTLRSEENYSNGLLEGPSKEFGPDGSLLVTGQYARGRVVGEWKRYWRQKQLRWSGAFVDGKKDGKWMYWTQSGQLRASVEWALGVRKSDWKPLIAHKPLTPAERAKLAEAQCNAGSENYCADAGAGFLQKGCELGAAGACAAIAEKLPASEASQRDKLFERVCVLTLDANCSEKAKRWPAVIPEMEMGCEKGIAGDCERLSWWYSYKADPL